MLKKAIQENRIVAVYQPVINYKTNGIEYTEASARIVDTNGNLVDADMAKLIWDAEIHGYIGELNKSVARNVAGFILDTGAFGVGRIGLRVSPRQFEYDECWADTLICRLKNLGIAFNKVAYEITERWFIRDLDNTKYNIEKLQSLGILVIMNGYGAGNTSLELVRSLPFNAIRLDRKLTREVFNHGLDEVFYRQSLHNLSYAGVTIIADGVDSYEDYRDLKTIGVECYQGSYISEPLLEYDYTAWVKERREKPWSIVMET